MNAGDSAAFVSHANGRQGPRLECDRMGGGADLHIPWKALRSLDEPPPPGGLIKDCQGFLRIVQLGPIPSRHKSPNMLGERHKIDEIAVAAAD